MTGSASRLSSWFNLLPQGADASDDVGIRISGSVSTYTNNSGASNYSSIVVESSEGSHSSSQDRGFVPGATSASANATATATAQGATTSVTVSVPVGEQEGSVEPTEDSQTHDLDEEPDIGDSSGEADETSQTTLTTTVSVLLGTPEGSLLVSTLQQDIFWGGGGADNFQLSAIGVMELSQADIMLDYSRATGDYLTLGEGLTVDDLVLEVIDFSGDGNPESTVIRSNIDDSILSIIVNTVNAQGETLLSAADFADVATVEARFPSKADDSATTAPDLESSGELDQPDNSQASSSSSSFVDGSGAGSSSSATATSATGETSTSGETVYTPGASSSGGSATATANAEGVNTTASAQAPLLDVLIGTAENDILVGTDNRNIFIGNGGADIFVLSATEKISLETADIIVDFSSEQGDLIQLPSGIAFSDITLQAVDIDSNGTLDGTLIEAIGTGVIYAVGLGTVDILGTSTRVAHNFITSDFA